MSPIVPPDQSLPEITVKAVILSIMLSAILAAANAYLGLFAGMTISASIPAAVASMAMLRAFRRSNILENNIIQTAASSGEALAAGVIFTIPALVLIGYWETFAYWQTVAAAAVGGLLGVLCTIPLRRALIVEAELRFPEGLATAEVLKSGWAGDAAGGVRALVAASALGALAKLGESGLKLWTDSVEAATRAGGAVWYAGMNLSPALIAVGFILRWHNAVIVFTGGAIGWLVLLPLETWWHGMSVGGPALEAAMTVWSSRIRYVGIGAMLVGGLWTLGELRRPVLHSLRALAAPKGGLPATGGVPRTERDASLGWIATLFVAALVPMAAIYAAVVGEWPIGIAMTVIMAAAAFLFASVAGYMAGLVGSSSNPVSGMTIATLMLSALLLVAVLGPGHPAGPASALLIAAVVCCAAAMGGDNLQDLKTGHLVGATPWKQQVMQVIGVVTGALVLVPVLALLQAKYGIGPVTAAHPHPLTAPQATLMANLARGVFGAGLPWPLVALGGAIAAVLIVIDRRLAARGSSWRLPVLAVALGIYLPLKLSAAILMGGAIQELVRRRGGAESPRGLLCAAGLITGEALMGILLAVPIAFSGMWPALSGDPLAVFAEPPAGGWPGVLAIALLAGWLYRQALFSNVPA